MTREEEIELLQRWRDGDQEAANELLKWTRSKIQRAVKNLAHARTGSDDAEDVLSDVFVTAAEKVTTGIYRIDGTARFHTWCISVAERITRRRRPSPPPFPDDFDVIDAYYVLPPDFLILKEVRERLHSAILELPDDPDDPLRTIFFLRYGFRIVQGQVESGYGKLTNEKISKLYNRKRGWASARYTRALQILKGKLDDVWPM